MLNLGPVIAVVLALVVAIVIAVIAWKLSSGKFFPNPQDDPPDGNDQQD